MRLRHTRACATNDCDPASSRTRERADTFVERHVDRVEERGDFLVRAGCVALACFPQPRPVEVHANAASPRQRGKLHEVVEGRKLAADLARGELHQEGGEPLGPRGQVGSRRGARRRAEQHRIQSLHPGIAAHLVQFEMRGGMHRECGDAGFLGMDAQCDLLCHGAARHEDGALATEQRSDPGLEAGDQRTFAVPVVLVAVRLAPLPHRDELGAGIGLRHASKDGRAAPPQRIALGRW